jgi:hypothetical protein
LRNFLGGRFRNATRELQVESRSGVVTLRGCVPSYYQKQLLQESCWRVAGVVGLLNSLDVAPDNSRSHRPAPFARALPSHVPAIEGPIPALNSSRRNSPA